MRKHLLALAALLTLLSPPAKAADSTLALLTAAGAVSGADLLYCTQAGADRKCTATQMAAYVYGLMSGDATASGVGAFTLATVNTNVGSFGSATQCTSFTVNGKGLITAASQATCTPALSSVTGFGSGVATALGNALSAAGGVTSTIASGATALATAAIGSGACATVQTVAAANVASTDTIMITPNASIKAVTGYSPATTGGLTITPYPTAGNVNFDVCNPTSSSITPGAVTVNWRVVR